MAAVAESSGGFDAIGQQVEVAYHDVEGDGDVLRPDAFVGMVADAARASGGTASPSARRRPSRRHRARRRWPAGAGRARPAATARPSRSVRRGIGRDGGMMLLSATTEFHAPRAASAAARAQELGHRRRPDLVVAGAGRRRSAGAVPGTTFDAPGSTAIVPTVARRPSTDRPSRSTSRTSSAAAASASRRPVHRRGPGMSRPAADLGPDPALPGDRLDHARPAPPAPRAPAPARCGPPGSRAGRRRDTRPRRSASGRARTPGTRRPSRCPSASVRSSSRRSNRPQAARLPRYGTP